MTINKYIVNLLHEFTQSKSDATSIEASQMEKLQLDFLEFLESKEFIEPVKAVQDSDSHWYVIPAGELETFISLDDSGMPEQFNIQFGKYRTNGDLNNVELFAIL